MALSNRGTHFTKLPEYFEAVMKCWADLYNETSNPNGYINLGVAENMLCSAEMAQLLNKVKNVTPTTFGYGDFRGSLTLRTQLASLFAKNIFKTSEPIDADHFYMCNGAGSVVEQVCASLGDAGDLIMIPAPMYHGFENDINRRMMCELLPVQLKEVQVSEYEYLFQLDMDAIEIAYQQAISKGKKVVAFIHTNPHNPSGLIFTEQETVTIMKWCLEHKIHFLSDEVYALSLFPQVQVPFVSAMHLCKLHNYEHYKDYVHIIWSFSKDFGLNGFRAGVLYTENPQLKSAMNACSYFTGISADTDHLLACMLKEETFINEYIVMNQQRMKHAYDKMEKFMMENKIPIVKAQGSMFIFANLIKTRPKYQQTLQGEKQLWNDMLSSSCKVYLTPGFVFYLDQAGWFRCCVTATKEETLMLAWKRILNIIQ